MSFEERAAERTDNTAVINSRFMGALLSCSLGLFYPRHQRRLGLGTEQLVDGYQRWRGVSDATLLEHQR